MPVNRKYEVGKVYSINVSELKPNPEQPRKYFDEDEIKALAADIKKMVFCKISLLLTMVVG